MARLPTIDGDDDAWGTVMNDWAVQTHNDDGSHKGGLVPAGGSVGDFLTKNTTATDYDVVWTPSTKEVFYQELLVDTTVPTGQTVTVFNASVDVTDLTQGQIVFDIPAWEYTNNQGGNSIINFLWGATALDNTTVMGQINAKNPISWPAQFSRQLNLSAFDNAVFAVTVQSVAQQCIIHAGPNYGATSVRITGV
jgi:hypothetical protein